MSNQSPVIAKNIPEGLTSSSSNKKVTPMWVSLLGAAIFLIVIVVAVSIFSGDKKEQPAERIKQEVPTTESAANGARPIKNNNTSQQQEMGGMPVENGMQNTSGQNGNVAELRIYKDAATNVEMVQTPSGPVPTASIEGQKFIEDYSRLKQEVGNGSQTTANGQQGQVDNSQLAALTEVTNSQIQALDEKINSMYETNDDLQEVIRKQNETIEKMAVQIKTIQPLVKSPKELAQELFGKNGERVLQSRNRQIRVDSVVGDKAFFTAKDNTVYILRVGDVIPHTSQKIIKIDEVTQSVIVAY